MTRFAYLLGCATALPLIWGCSSSAAPEEGASQAALGEDASADGGNGGDNYVNPNCGSSASPGTINANIGSKSIEIESAFGPATNCHGVTYSSAMPYNANLFSPQTDNHPSDGTPRDFDNCPEGASESAWTDWGNLSDPDVHRCNDVAANDTSAFGNGSCVFRANSPKKGDITGTAFANNAQNLYLALTRADNTGDVAFTYVFTKAKTLLADCTCNSPGCLSANGGFMPEYKLAAGDIVLAGDYPQSAGSVPVIGVWKVKDGSSATLNSADLIGSLPAIGASGGIWDNVATGVVAAANIDATKRADAILPTAATAQTTIAGDASYMLSQIVLEMAVPMSAIQSNFNICNAGGFYVNVISRSSTSPGSDLKDYIGGLYLNLGELGAQPVVSTRCDDATGGTKIDVSVSSITARDGSTKSPDASGAFTGYSCEWSCTDGTDTKKAEACKYTFAGFTTSGSWTCSVKILETTGDGCDKTFSASPVDVYGPIGGTATLSGDCDPSFSWSAAPTGGSGSYICEWTFSGPPGAPVGSTSCSGDTGKLGISIDTGGANVSGSVKVSDSRGCAVDFNAGATKMYSPGAVSITPTALPPSCPAIDPGSDAVTFSALVTGGNAPLLTWTGCSPAGLDCFVDFDPALFCPSQDVQATITDAVCPGSASLMYTVKKETTITTALK